MADAKMYYDQDADLNLLKGKKIAIIGYGSQGHAQALNLKESGLNVVVAEVPGSDNYKMAVEAGRAAFESGMAAPQESASATSPLTAFLD